MHLSEVVRARWIVAEQAHYRAEQQARCLIAEWVQFREAEQSHSLVALQDQAQQSAPASFHGLWHDLHPLECKGWRV
jgi:hypothetical protein